MVLYLKHYFFYHVRWFKKYKTLILTYIPPRLCVYRFNRGFNDFFHIIPKSTQLKVIINFSSNRMYFTSENITFRQHTLFRQGFPLILCGRRRNRNIIRTKSKHNPNEIEIYNDRWTTNASWNPYVGAVRTVGCRNRLRKCVITTISVRFLPSFGSYSESRVFNLNTKNTLKFLEARGMPLSGLL